MPKGCQFAVDIAAMGQNQVWGDNPQLFDPSRFLGNALN